MSKIEEIRNKVIEANSEIVGEREVVNVIINNPNGDSIEEQGFTAYEYDRSIRLADVFLAMERELEDGTRLRPHWDRQHNLLIYWNLKETLENQSEKTINFIHDLLCKLTNY